MTRVKKLSLQNLCGSGLPLANQIAKASKIPDTVEYIGMVSDFKNGKSGLVFEVCADLSLVTEDAERIAKDAPTDVWSEIDYDSLPDCTKRTVSSLRSGVVFPKLHRFNSTKKVQMARNVACATHGIHKAGCLHRDPAARNVLCDREGNVRVCDFGLCVFVGASEDTDDQDIFLRYSTDPTPDHPYPIAWWAPEFLSYTVNEEPIFSNASDVYSLGSLFYQVFANDDPFSDFLRDDNGDSLRSAILEGKRPNLDKLKNETPAGIRELIAQCWATDPSDRPTLPDIAARLDEILEDMKQSAEPMLRRLTSSGKQPEKHWFDVQDMYRSFSKATLVQNAHAVTEDAGLPFHESYLVRHMTAKLRDAASMKLSESILEKLDRRCPRDVFLIDAGEQKCVEVSCLKRSLAHGLS